MKEYILALNLSSSHRIALITCHYKRVGGISTYVRNIEYFTRKLGNPLYIFSTDITSDSLDEYHVLIRKKHKLSIAIELLTHLLHKNITYVQCHGPWYLALGCLMYKYARLLSKRQCFVLLFHHSDIYTRMRTVPFNILLCLDMLSDAVGFSSNYLKNSYMSRALLVRRNKLTVIPPGARNLNTPPADVHDTLRYHLVLSWPIISYIGLFEYYAKVKGILLLLDCIRVLRVTYPQLVCLIGGKGRYISLIKTTIQKYRLDNNVIILENIYDPRDVLKFSNVHCHLTFQDSFPLTVLEALDSGVPVVASNVGEIPFIRIQGLTVVENERDKIVIALHNAILNVSSVDHSALHLKYAWTQSVDKLLRLPSRA